MTIIRLKVPLTESQAISLYINMRIGLHRAKSLGGSVTVYSKVAKAIKLGFSPELLAELNTIIDIAIAEFDKPSVERASMLGGWDGMKLNIENALKNYRNEGL